jgi:AcrR family transcriptional regulator
VTTTRKRRSSSEIRTLILEAARELFLAHGYEATTTKDIARHAGVLESLLFTNFESKAGVFNAAFVAPFSELVDRYMAAWERRSAASVPNEAIEAFIEGLFDFVSENRVILRASVAQRMNGAKQDGDLLEQLMASVHRFGGIESVRREYPAMDVPATVAAVVGMVLGVALFDDMLYPVGSRRPSRKRLKAEMVRTLMEGITHRAQDDARR